MTDKEKEIELIKAIEGEIDYGRVREMKNDSIALMIVEKIKSLGYRPTNYTLISDEKIINIMGGREYGVDHLPLPIDDCHSVTLHRAKTLAQAQLDHIKEH